MFSTVHGDMITEKPGVGTEGGILSAEMCFKPTLIGASLSEPHTSESNYDERFQTEHCTTTLSEL